MRSRWRSALGLALSIGVTTSFASAQDAVPPRVKSLPTVEVPEGVEMPEGRKVRLRVRIDAEGRAVVEQCAAGVSLCELIQSAIAESTFEAATQDGIAVPSRVQVDVRLRAPPPAEDPSLQEPQSTEPAPDLSFSETAEIDARMHQPIQLELDGIRNIPGTLGDPFRTLLLMPGVVPIANGQPYGYVRGAPPVGTLYEFDELRVPLLFHSAIGPSTIHPALVRDVRLYGGAPPARYGTFTGGVMSGRVRDIPDDRVHGEAELRAVDVSAMLHTPLPKKTSMTFSGRYGFPNLVLGALGVDARVDYWDYQYRFDAPISARARFELVAFGARDSSAFDENDPRDALALDLQFHRVEARFIGRVGDWELVGTMLYGYDASIVRDGSAMSVPDATSSIHRFGPRFWAIYVKPKFQLRLGGDVQGLFGSVTCRVDPFTEIVTPCDPRYAAENRRVFTGGYAEMNFAPSPWIDLSLGARVDLWSTARQREVAVSPRARVTFHAKDFADLFAGWGFGTMPATYPIPLPGLGDIPLEPGVQRANQTEAGVRLFLPKDVSVEARGYLNLYKDIRFFDVFTSAGISVAGGLTAGFIDDTAQGKSYGLEVLLERPFQLGFSSFLAYTLGYSDLDATARSLVGAPSQTLEYTPSYDVRHVLNAVLAWQSNFGLTISARLSTRSGRAEGWLWLDDEGNVQQYVQRVPWFTRLDAQIAYEWAKPGRAMRIALEWINITQARDAQQLGVNPGACAERFGVPEEPCSVEFTTAIWFPNLSFRATF